MSGYDEKCTSIRHGNAFEVPELSRIPQEMAWMSKRTPTGRSNRKGMRFGPENQTFGDVICSAEQRKEFIASSEEGCRYENRGNIRWIGAGGERSATS